MKLTFMLRNFDANGSGVHNYDSAVNRLTTYTTDRVANIAVLVLLPIVSAILFHIFFRRRRSHFFWQYSIPILIQFSVVQRIRGVPVHDDALYKSTFYLLTYLLVRCTSWVCQHYCV